MTRYAALLHSINLGSKNKIAMADLRALVEELGHTDVKTYINSGNVVFTPRTPGPGAVLATVIEEAIEARLGLAIAVQVRTHDDFAKVLEANPFPDAEPARLLITFMSREPAAGIEDDLAKVASGDDELRVIGTTAYMHCPDGMGRSKLAAALSRRRDVNGTVRNLLTVRKLLDMTA